MNVAVRKTLYFSLVLVVGFCILIPALRGDFFYDEFDFLDGALRVKHNIATGQGSVLDLVQSDFVFHAPSEYPYPHYRPAGYTLTYLLLLFNGADATTYILFGILTHLVVALVFFKLAIVLLKNELKAFCAALLFVCQAWGIHAVIWPAACVLYLPSALCQILIILFFIYYLDTKRIGWLLLSAALLFFDFTFYEVANIAIFILFAYYIFTQLTIQKKRIWLFFVRPIFYPYYAVILLWTIILAHQNLALRKSSYLLSIKNALNPESIIITFQMIINSLTTEFEIAFGGLISPGTMHLASYAYMLLLIAFLIASVIVFLKSKQPIPVFLLIWLLIEVVPRFMLAGISTRGFYTIAFPFTLILVELIFRMAKAISRLLHSRISETAIVIVILLALAANQAIRAEARVSRWVGITNYIRAETNQLYEETGTIDSYHQLILMAPTPQQHEMFNIVNRDNFCKRIHAYLNDPTVEVHYQPFDSADAVLLSRQPGHHVLVGLPGCYHLYSSDLDISALIPGDLQYHYQIYLEERAKSKRSKFKRDREIDF